MVETRSALKRRRRPPVVFSELPDDTLTDWAVGGDVEAVQELHRRHCSAAVQFAAVVSGRPEDAPEMAVAAFSRTLHELSDGESVIEGGFLPRLLRCTRAVALDTGDPGVDAHQLARTVPPGTSPELLAEVFSGLTEPERSALWLGQVAGLGTHDADVALAVSGGTSVLRWTRPRSTGFEALIARASATLGDHHAAAVATLATLQPALDERHVESVIAARPKRPRASIRWNRPAWQAQAAGDPRDVATTRFLRLAAAAVIVAALLGVVVSQRDNSSAPTRALASRLELTTSTTDQGPSNGSSNGKSGGQATPGTGGNAPPTSGSSGTRPGTSNRAPGDPSPGNSGTTPDAPGSQSEGAAPSRVGNIAARATTLGVGPDASDPSATTEPAPPADPTPTTRDKGDGTVPRTSVPGTSPTVSTAPTTEPPQGTPTTTTPPTDPPATTEPPTTTEPTTEPPATTEPTTEPPATTEPPTTSPGPVEPPSPPTTLPPVPLQ